MVRFLCLYTVLLEFLFFFGFSLFGGWYIFWCYGVVMKSSYIVRVIYLLVGLEFFEYIDLWMDCDCFFCGLFFLLV